MHNWGIILISLFFLTACKSVPKYSRFIFNNTYSHREVPYSFSRESSDQKLAVLLNDNPDTFKLADSPLTRKLHDLNYAILIPGKPGEDPLTQYSSDTKDAYTEDIFFLLRSLRDDFNEILIIGVGEGGYLIPGISKNVTIDRSFMINVAPQGRLHEMEEIIKDTLPIKKAELVKRQHAYSEKQLLERIKIIRETQSDVEQIAPGTNRYWRSYEENTLLEELPLMESPADWIVFNRYPFITNESRRVAKLICEALSKHTYKELPGKGYLNEEEDMQALTGYIISRLNTKR